MYKWRIYYGNDDTFSNLDGNITDAPAWDVQDIIQKDIDDPRKKYHQGQSDFYIFKDRWIGVDLIGLIDYLANELKLVKFGRTITTDKYQQIRQRADKDPDFK